MTLLALVLAVPSAAHASTVSLTMRNVPGYKGSGYDEAVVTIAAARGEANDVGVRLQHDVVDGGPGADQMSGGAGHDTVSYSDRGAPVSATIGGPGGEVGEGDAIGPDVEEIQGGTGPDVLRGGPRDDSILGGPAADVIDPGPGRDKAGSLGGADRLLLRDGEADEGYCPGSGSAVADGHDLVLHCPTVDRVGAGHVFLHIEQTGSTRRFYRVPLLCSNDLRPKCAGVVRLLTGGRPAGRARFTVRAGHTRTVSIELRAGARRRLVSARQLALVVRVDTRDAAGRPVVLRAPGTARAR